MKKNYIFQLNSYYLFLLIFFTALNVNGQNFSGLQNKKLIAVNDLGSLLETQIGGLLSGKIKGSIDSVVVTYDTEKSLKAKIYYSGFANGYFTVLALNSARQKQNEISPVKFSQTSMASPAECTLLLDPSVAKGSKLETPFLRIDASKSENLSGNVNVYSLNKNWKSELDPQNVVINMTLQPVGKATSLSNSKINIDVIPTRTILFDRKVLGAAQPIGTATVRPSGTGTAVPVPPSGTGTAVPVSPSVMGRAVPVAASGMGRAMPARPAAGENNAQDKPMVLSNTKMLGIYGIRQAAAIKTTPTDQPVSTSKEPTGPESTPFYLLEELKVDEEVDFQRPQDISNINIYIYADKNDKSGVYYILPADYHLKWETKTEPEKGFEFRILYGSQKSGDAAETATDAPVRMSATLTAGISMRERNFVKSLLKSNFPDFKELRFLPLKENPQFTFQNTLGNQYNIAQNKITVETNSDLTSDIHVAWQTNADTKEFIQTALTSREGISASVILKPKSDDILEQQIPAIINLADSRTIGKLYLEPNTWRSTNFRNTTPFPLKLKYLHVLKMETNGKTPIIYSWSLNNGVVPSQGQAAFDHSKVPVWLDNDPSSVMWFDYSIENCSNCDQKVMDAVTGGVSGNKALSIKFTIAPAVFDTLRASYFSVTVRSRQVDPKGEEVKELAAIKITKDAVKEFSVGPLFIPAGGAAEFEYKITMASTDGDFYPSNEWIKGTDKEVLLGKTRMKAIFRGIVPGIN
jgi:hypothetical protein